MERELKLRALPNKTMDCFVDALVRDAPTILKVSKNLQSELNPTHRVVSRGIRVKMLKWATPSILT